MDLVTAEIMIGGDLRNTVVKGAHNPITVPEIEVLKMVHGENAIKVGDVCGYVKRKARAEKTRLVLIYGKKILEAVYPGVNGNGIDTGTDPEAVVEDVPKKASSSRKRSLA